MTKEQVMTEKTTTKNKKREHSFDSHYVSPVTCPDITVMVDWALQTNFPTLPLPWKPAMVTVISTRGYHQAEFKTKTLLTLLLPVRGSKSVHQCQDQDVARFL